MKFRSLFKLGVFARSEKKYKEALIFFDMILRRLQAKDAIGYVDPLELEYMQKAYLQKCIVYHDQEYYEKAKENMKLAEMVKSKIDTTEFYNILYSGNADYFKQLSKNRVNIEQFKKLLKNAENVES